jgi:ABC-2 type transport system ATP-binding protein
MIRVEGLHKRFVLGHPLRLLVRRPRSSVEVLNDVSLSVAPGEFLALLGANGAGKTTLLKTIATLLHPDRGRVSVCGHDTVSDEHRARSLVGCVLADERSFHWRLNSRENLEFFAALSGLRSAEARLRIRTLLEALDLAAVAGQSFGQLSTGMKQRLAVARALLARPRVLLLDEPVRSIDAAHAAEIWQLVRREVAAVDGCVVLVSHQIQEALDLCERVAILAGGRIALDTSSQRIQSAALGLEGLTIAVRGLERRSIPHLERFPGVRSIRVATQTAEEETLEVWTVGNELDLAGFVAELTGSGATICSLQRTPPLQGVLERLAAVAVDAAGAREVAV